MALKNMISLFSILLVFIACNADKQKNTNSTDFPEPPPEEKTMTIEEKARFLAKKFIITDGHIDIPYRLNNQMEDVSIRTQGGDFDYVRAKEGGLDAPFMSIYVPSSYQQNGGAKDFAEDMIGIVENMIRNHPDKFAAALSPADVKANFERGLVSLPMGMENGAPVEGQLDNIRYFYDRGIRYITLTHGKDNEICDSSYDKQRTWNGLSPFGKKVVEEMNNVGIMVDISHVSDSAFYQVAKMTKAPLIASHSSCRHFTEGFERNMSDDMIKRLAEVGGVIQINFGSTFLDERSRRSDRDSIDFVFSNVQKVADHIDHVVNIAGIDYVGIGSDFDGVGNTLPEGLKDVSQYPNLILELLKRGYTDEEIEKICCQNVFRVWEAVQKVADSF